MKIKSILTIILLLSAPTTSISMAMLTRCRSLTKTRGFLPQKRTNMSHLLFMPNIQITPINEPREVNEEIKKAEDIYKKFAKESQKNILEKLNYQTPASDALLGIGKSIKQYRFNFLQDELLLRDARTLLDEQLEKSDPLHDLILNIPILQKKSIEDQLKESCTIHANFGLCSIPIAIFIDEIEDPFLKKLYLFRSIGNLLISSLHSCKNNSDKEFDAVLSDIYCLYGILKKYSDFYDLFRLAIPRKEPHLNANEFCVIGAKISHLNRHKQKIYPVELAERIINKRKEMDYEEKMEVKYKQLWDIFYNTQI